MSIDWLSVMQGNGGNWSVSGEWEALSGDELMLSVLGVLDLAEKVGKR